MDAADQWALHNPWAPVLIPVGTVVGAWLYPRTAHWSNSAGDTCLILSAGAGVAMACHFNASAHTAACAVRSSVPQSLEEFLAALPYVSLALGIILVGRSAAKAAVLPVVRAVTTSAVYMSTVGSHADGPSAGQTPFQARLASLGTHETSALISPPQGEEVTPGVASPVAGKKEQLRERGAHVHKDKDTDADEKHCGKVRDMHSPGAEYDWRYDIEIPVKVIVYGIVGLNAAHTCIVVLQALGYRDFGYTVGTLPQIV